MTTPLPAHLVRKLDVADCWTWSGRRTDGGYARVQYTYRTWYVHRLVWTLLVGEIPDGLVLDHLCKNRACCNPDHLEVVTQAENVRRSAHAGHRVTHCPQGHEYTPENTYYRRDRYGRNCKACERARSVIRWQTQKGPTPS